MLALLALRVLLVQPLVQWHRSALVPELVYVNAQAAGFHRPLVLAELPGSWGGGRFDCVTGVFDIGLFALVCPAAIVRAVTLAPLEPCN